VQSLGVGAGALLAGCSGSGESDRQLGGSTSDGGGGSGERALFWEYAFPNDGSKPIWKNAFLDRYEERSGEQLRIGRFAYEDLRQKFLTGARTGNPDAIEGVLGHLTEYIIAGHLEPLGERAEGLGYLDGFTDSALDAMRYRGKLYGLPYQGNGRALIYRTDVLEELGQEKPKTAAAFQEIGRLINEEYDDMWAYHNCTKTGSVRAFQEWMSHVYQHTDQMFVPEGDSWKLNISADALGQVFDNWYYQVWAADEPLGNPDQLGTGWQVNDPGYLNGEFAFIECGTWIRSWTTGENIENSEKTTEILNEKTRVGHLPHAEGASKGTFLEVKPVMMNTHSTQKDLAWDAIAAFTNPETLRAMAEDVPGNAMTPVHEEVESTIESEDWRPFIDVFETGRALAKIGWGPVRQPFYRYMQEVSYGKKDPYAAGDQFHEELKALASDL
jgi:ABC-type glycerol-3-phosphate transport system substrate-binding protein